MAVPSSAGPGEDDPHEPEPAAAFDETAETDRFVRRQRRDALAAIRVVPGGLFRPRLSRQPALIAVVALALIVPAVVLPRPQDAVIAQQQQVRAGRRTPGREDRSRGRGAWCEGPRPERPADARWPRSSATWRASCASTPTTSDVNLAKLGSIENDVRAQVDPANEQRAASLTSLSRSLSSAATGKPDANRDGDPEKAKQDLADLADKLDTLTPDQRRELAEQLAGMEASASGAGWRRRDRASTMPPRARPRATPPAPGPPSIGSATR